MIRGWDRPTSGSPTLAGHHRWARAEVRPTSCYPWIPLAVCLLPWYIFWDPCLPVFTQEELCCFHGVSVTFSLLLSPFRK